MGNVRREIPIWHYSGDSPECSVKPWFQNEHAARLEVHSSHHARRQRQSATDEIAGLIAGAIRGREITNIHHEKTRIQLWASQRTRNNDGYDQIVEHLADNDPYHLDPMKKPPPPVWERGQAVS